MARWIWLFAFVMGLSACGDDGGDAGGGDGGAGGGVDGGPGEFGDGGNANEACRHLDLVISVDPSGSMGDELEAMRDDVFPAFATRLPQISGGLDDFRVATLDACPTPANFHTRGAGGECDFEGGNVWIESSSTTLEDEFACVGDIDRDNDCTGSNDDEQPASAAATALEPPFLDGANAGFLRDDALLVIIAITDEDEQPTPDASAQQVYDRLLAVKGDVRRMVFIGVGGGSDCNGVYGTADEAVKLRAITDLFIAEDRGVWKDLCVGNLEDGLDEAFAVIESACDELPQVD
jgi:hypothetical protein